MTSIIVNGQKTSVTDNPSVTALLSELSVKMPDMVTVELNGEIQERKNFETTVLKEGDRVEFLYFMGGGRSGQDEG